MNDIVRQTAQAGHIVVWEEVARDGAQAKTIMSGAQRVQIARMHAALHGAYSANHLIFAAGFPSICPEEVEAMRELVAEVDTCSLVAHVRASRSDIDLGIETMRGARFGRITFITPTSEIMAQTMIHQSAANAVDRAVELARYAVDKAARYGLAVDSSLVDVPRADPSLVAELANRLTEEGVTVIKLCDTLGMSYPLQNSTMYTMIKRRVSERVVLGVHNHNDFGLALANNVEAVRAGINVIATAWLGLAERCGLATTEQLLFLLSYAPERMAELLGEARDLWLSPPDLTLLRPIAQQVSQITGTPLKITDPIVGTSINTISTGTPFVAPEAFQPFDPEQVLGVGRTIYLTQLASTRVITAVCDEMGYILNQNQVAAALRWVKTQAYHTGRAVVPRAEFTAFLDGLLAYD